MGVVVAKVGEEMYGVLPGGAVVGIQTWSGFMRNRHALVTSIDGKPLIKAGTKAQVQQWFGQRSLGEGAVRVDAGRARALLAERGFDPGVCGCEQPLPIAAPWCDKCGAKVDR